MKSITILPAKGCRRSRKIMKYLQDNRIPFQRIELDSKEGMHLKNEYNFLASPGILVDGVSINPFDLFIRPECRIDEQKARLIFDLQGE